MNAKDSLAEFVASLRDSIQKTLAQAEYIATADLSEVAALVTDEEVRHLLNMSRAELAGQDRAFEIISNVIRQRLKEIPKSQPHEMN